MKSGLSVVIAALSLSACAALGQASLSITHGKSESPVIGLPFTADQSVRTVQQLNGITLTNEMKGHVYRSTNGRLRFEGTLVATDPTQPKPATLNWIIDPAQHSALSWNTNSTTAMRTAIPENSAVMVKYLPVPRTPGGHPNQPENLMTTDLGHQTRDKLHLVGKRVTGTIPTGKIGNEQPIEVTTDVWVSPELKLIVNEVEQDPRTGNRMFELTNIVRKEPDAALFELPAGYTVKEQSNLPIALGMVPPVPRPPAPVSSAILQQIADASKDPNPEVKIDVAYELAMDKVALSDARSLAEKGIQLEEQQTIDLDLKNITADNFSQMTNLCRAWTALGWIYFQQGDLAKAELYTRAAWELDPQGYLGSHLGRIYEMQHRIPDAINAYRMALSARASAKQQDQIHSRLVSLSMINAEPLPFARPTPLPSLTAKTNEPAGDAVFDILLSHSDPPVVLFRSGSPTLKDSAAAAIQSTLRASLPDEGPEKVLRRGRVTCSTGIAPTCTLLLLTMPEAKAAGASLVN
ncbi:tetratricopeptide repeat protein [Granulicella arctica]|uniref:Tetratricopeptide repeat protein n=1 Tax=Granulicella arctica TaxID=940613 RepID=A0A7Y9PHZ5_9BACT|nr:hypothetical protein [Granulicella arctica]NYF80258.1 hypothetical protein [Granulicella arctica]